MGFSKTQKARSRPNCCECGKKVTGYPHSKFRGLNTMVKPQFYCERCYQLKGQPAPLSLSKLYLKTYA